jgi:UDP-glucose:(heptosyl)LPS alpha-1,3-glucosyltransferase
MPPALRPLKRVAARLLPRYREFQQLLSRQYGDHHRLFIALSKMVARDLEQYHDVPTERIRIVYNGVDTERFSPRRRAAHRATTRGRLGVDDDEMLLLILAHNFRLKGVATAIRSAGRLASEGLPVRLAVAGGGPIGPYRRLAERCGVADRVHFVGAVDDPVPLYAAADVYVQPTWYDPCSLVALEALAAGLPVVTTRFNGAGELITAGREGDLLDDPSDDMAWAECLGGYFDRPRHKLMQEAARRLAERHDLDHNCDEIIAAYEEQAERRRAA